jgi:hypothetical protein
MECGHKTIEHEYQEASTILLEEVIKEPVDSAIPIIKVTSSIDTPTEEIERKVREKLVEHNWWLQDYWKEKGAPKEQIVIQTAVGNIEVFNFGDFLNLDQLKELQDIVIALGPLNGGELFQEISYILIDENQEINPNTGEKTYGYGPAGEKAVKLYPRGTKLTPYRIPEVSSFSGTIIHEFSHALTDDLEKDWIQEFKWRMLEEPRELPGGSYQYRETDEPERCVNNYAALRACDDICESVVAYVAGSKKLDEQKKEFLKTRLFERNVAEAFDISVTQKIGKQVELPKVEEPVLYMREKQEIVVKLRKKINK